MIEKGKKNDQEYTVRIQNDNKNFAALFYRPTDRNVYGIARAHRRRDRADADH